MKTIFAERLQEIRKDKGYTQEKLATILDIPKTTISSWERGLGEPPSATKIKIAKILGTTTGYLIGETDTPYRDEVIEMKDDSQIFFRFDTSKMNEEEKKTFKKQVNAYAKFLLEDLDEEK